MRTTVLSKSWKYIWISVTNIELESTLGRRECFLDFVKRVLLLHDSSYTKKEDVTPIKRIRLCSKDEEVDPLNINSWISCLVNHEVEMVDFSLDVTKCFKLSYALFTLQRLVVLKLDVDFVLEMPDSMSLPMLKKLFLNDATFLGNSSVLETLSHKCCGWRNLKGTVRVCTPTLKSFIFIACEGPWKTLIDFQINIHASQLASLTYASDFIHECIVRDAPSSVNTHILDLREATVKRVFRLLTSVRSMRALEFDGGSPMEAGQLSDRLPNFFKLKSLTLQLDVTQEKLRLVMRFLENTPILECLDIGITGDDGVFGDPVEFWEMDVSPSCLNSHLKRINVKRFHGYLDEVYLLDVLLSECAALERLHVSCENNEVFSNGGITKWENVIKQLPRSSEKCVIRFSSAF